MSKAKVNTLKLGLFIVSAAALFVAAVYLIGSEQNLFQPTFQLNAVFQNAEGLKPGNNVRYVGIDAGTVQNIVITSDSTLRVEMILQKEMQSYIKKDAIASIGSDGLVGNKIINISPGLSNGSTALVEHLDIIQSYSRVATDDMLEVLGKTNENIALFSLEMLRISEKINQGSGTMNMLLQDAALAKDLQQSIINLKLTTQSLYIMGQEMQTSLVQLNKGNGLLHDLLYDTTVMVDLRTLSGDLAQIVDQKVEPLFLDLQQSADQLAQASLAVNEMLQQVKAGEGTIGALLQDPNMENDLQETLANINQSAQRFNENMEAMRHNFLFKGYFKKMEKQERKSLKK